MNRSMISLLTACFALVGCGAESLPNPVVVQTDAADAWDGYEAALATSQSQGYPIVVNDRHHFSLLVQAEPSRAKQTADEQATSEAYFGIQALPGGPVEIFVEEPAGHAVDQVEARTLRRQMEQLAWGIGQRAQILGGEPSSAAYSPAPLPPVWQQSP